MYDERGLERFITHTMRSLHAGMVAKRRSLKELLADPDPTTVTREGEVYHYDPGEVRRWGEAAMEEEALRLRLPLTLRFPLDLQDACYLDDEAGAAVLRRLEGFGSAYPFREGRMYLPYSLGMELLMKYPTTLQRIFMG